MENATLPHSINNSSCHLGNDLYFYRTKYDVRRINRYKFGLNSFLCSQQNEMAGQGSLMHW